MRFLRFILVIFMLSFCILVHEGGHYLAMRYYGVSVEEVSVGIGPVLLERDIGEGTMLQLRPIILGGYTRPSDAGIETMSRLEFFPDAVIHLMGISLNLMTGFIGLTFLYLFGHKPLYRFGTNTGPTLGGLSSTMHAAADTIIFAVVTPLLMLRYFFASITRSGREGLQARKDAIPKSARQSGHLEFLVLISLMLGTLNLLPFSPFDGSKVFADLIATAISAKAATLYMTYSLPAALFMICCTPFSPFDYYAELRHKATQR